MVRSVIRLVAFGLIILSCSLGASDLFLYLSMRPHSGPLVLTLKGLPFLAGVILFCKSSAMAAYLTKDLD